MCRFNSLHLSGKEEDRWQICCAWLLPVVCGFNNSLHLLEEDLAKLLTLFEVDGSGARMVDFSLDPAASRVEVSSDCFPCSGSLVIN